LNLPEFLDEAVFQLARPLARQKGLDFVTANVLIRCSTPQSDIDLDL